MPDLRLAGCVSRLLDWITAVLATGAGAILWVEEGQTQEQARQFSD